MTHNCDAYISQLYTYLDGELSDFECAHLRAHLKECPPCLQEYERDAILKALVRRSCASEAAPATLRAQIMTQITTVRVGDIRIHRT
ncbi:MAG: mycothiol system anti-sigma-R factor [Allobranchiibius sp.]